jgi:hypothetical protein
VKRIAAGLVGLGIMLTALIGLAAPANAAPAARTAVTPLAGTVIGIEFSDANYQGSTYTITGGTCTSTLSDIDWQLSPLAPGWNDVISSFHSYANCWTKLWENTGFWGGSYGFVGDSSYVGDAMNDRASSIQWS